jgi:hypothetical protein
MSSLSLSALVPAKWLTSIWLRGFGAANIGAGAYYLVLVQTNAIDSSAVGDGGAG